MITREELLSIANREAVHCVSIFIPTHREGDEESSKQDSLYLKNQLKAAKTKLAAKGLDENEIKKMLQQAEALVDDKSFWRDQSDGLAIFLAEGFFEYYTVPVDFKEQCYVSNEFYIKPMMPLFSGDKLFYILSLKADDVKMYEGELHSITDIFIEDVMPGQLEDRVGYDHEEKHVQFRTQQGNQGKGMYHGHGDSETDHKEEMLQFCKAVDNGVRNIIGDDQSIPLVLACSSTNAGIYRQANHYHGLWEEYIEGNPSELDPESLHEEAVDLLQSYFDKESKEHKEKVANLLGTGKASGDIKDVLDKTVQGMVDAVFIDKNADVFGTYDMTNMSIDIDKEQSNNNVSLLNLIATEVFKKGGAVYEVDREDMPDPTSEVNALYRA